MEWNWMGAGFVLIFLLLKGLIHQHLGSIWGDQPTVAAQDVGNIMKEEAMRDTMRESITAVGHTDGHLHHITAEDTGLAPDHVHIHLVVIEDKNLTWVIKAAVRHRVCGNRIFFYSFANR